ncbi:golgin subfamily A member 2-like isoform X2 [Atheta coriaria]|uniref:golgin subfamily A member 2-like isoform X2 n=1 Tax=Dalotia coriaria TaxID=877792 RepID=UPI0031F3964C
MLKSHQQKKQKKPESSTSDTRSIDSVTSSNESEVSTQRTNASPVPQIQSYFTTPAAMPTTASSTANYFDTVTSASVATSPELFSITSQNLTPSAPIVDNLHADSNNYVTSTDAVSYEDPEINPNEIFDFANQQQNNNVPELSMSEQMRQLTDQVTHAVDSNGYENYSNYSDLEKRNLELASSFEKEKLQCDQLNATINEYKNHINQLERQIELLRVECDNKIRVDLAPLENEISTHRQTIGILVGEKTELSATLNHTQMMLKHKTTECEELQARLKTSRSRVADLERELNCLKEERGRHAQMQTGHNQEFERMQNDVQVLKAQKSEAEHDLSEMRERLKKLQEENAVIIQNCNEYEGKLDLAQIKIQQLTTGADPGASEKFMQEKQALEKQILDLNSSLKNALGERDQASAQYQQYVQQLNGNISSLAEKLNSSTVENDNLMKRENELVQHISELEKRLQSQQQESNHIFKQPLHSEQSKEQSDSEIEQLHQQNERLEAVVADLQAKFDAVRNERDEFIQDVENKKLTIESLESTIERLKGNQTNNTQMLADIESEKVAASRAVEQNIKLKQQLEEMQEAFIRMTNDKAELLTQLSSEEFRYKELEDLQTQTIHQLHMLTEAIEIKDRELTQIRTKVEDVDKHVLHQDQLNDRLRHYEAHENSAHALTHELQHAKDEIHALINKNKQLEMKLADMESSEIKLNPEVHESEDVEMVTQSIQTEVEVDSAIPQVKNTEMTSAREIAMRQLENKFMRTMQEIANLQDEKQMLEHIVLQLQGETETIGEYIALYQHQRGVLKQRAIEKETQLKQLAKDREHMKFQLHMLNELIRRLLEENKISDGDLQEQKQINADASALCEEHAKMHLNMQDGESQGQETAQQIMALLGEIKTSNLVQPTDVSENFHPCPLCSGQLITV